MRRILLLGFMGSGKSTVGPLVAELLGWRFLDFDTAVEESAGKPVPAIFREDGEAVFREIEARVGGELLDLDGVVLSAGGGWPMTPGTMEGVPDGTLSVWLQVTPEEALRRSREAPGSRPLLDVPDPLSRARKLLEARSSRYGLAALTLDSEAETPQRLARRIADAARSDNPS